MKIPSLNGIEQSKVFKIEPRQKFTGTRIENIIDKLHSFVFDTVYLSAHLYALSVFICLVKLISINNWRLQALNERDNLVNAFKVLPA